MNLGQKCTCICFEALPVGEQVLSDSSRSLEEPKDSNEKSLKNELSKTVYITKVGIFTSKTKIFSFLEII